MSERRVGRYVIECSHESRIYFPKSKITKGELLDYYQAVAPHMLPYMRNRLMTLHRFPEGINHEGFFQKDIPDYFPSFIKRKNVRKQTEGSVNYLVCNNAATLVYAANQGTITPHIMQSKIDKLDYPDRIVFDLDPAGKARFSSIVDTAYALKEMIESRGLIPFVMTTGSRGLHVVIPIKRTRSFDVVKQWSREVAQELVDEYPKKLTLAMQINKRGDKIFIDYLRNSFGATAVAPYAVRADEKAPVATPLSWQELAQISSSQEYTIATIKKRLGAIKNPWAKYARSARLLKV